MGFLYAVVSWIVAPEMTGGGGRLLGAAAGDVEQVEVRRQQ